MAKLFLIRVGNRLDDTSYSKVIIVEDGYTAAEIKMCIGGDILPDLGEDFVIDIIETKPSYIAFTEDDFRIIEPTLKELHVI